jgi:hypothetical protein
VAVVLAFIALGAAPPASSRPVNQTTGPRSCTPVRGTFTNVFLLGPVNCPDSPVDQCTLGQLSGDLNGTYAFNFLTSEQAGNGRAPVSKFTGESAVTLQNATFAGQDFGVLRTTHFPLADFTTHLRIVSGAGELEGASGHLTIQGLASFLTGQGAGTYNGVICVPK